MARRFGDVLAQTRLGEGDSTNPFAKAPRARIPHGLRAARGADERGGVSVLRQPDLWGPPLQPHLPTTGVCLGVGASREVYNGRWLDVVLAKLRRIGSLGCGCLIVLVH